MPEDLIERESSQVLVVGNTVTPVGTSSIKGCKFLDLDFDGFRDGNEPGISGVTIFIDQNNDGILNNGELFKVTDQFGNYRFDGLAASDPNNSNTFYRIREVEFGLPQTTQVDNPLLKNPDPRGIDVILGQNQLWTGADIGNGPLFSFEVQKFFDANGNGAPDPGEPALPDIPFHIDLNGDNQIQTGEVFYTGGGLQNRVDPLGTIRINNARAGNYSVTELFNGSLFPAGQTRYTDSAADPDLPAFQNPLTTGAGPYPVPTLNKGTNVIKVPGPLAKVSAPLPAGLTIETLPRNPQMLTPEQIVGGGARSGQSLSETEAPERSSQQIGNAPPNLIAVKFNDLNANGVQDANEPVISGVTIFIDSNNNGVLDSGEPSGVTGGNGQVVFRSLAPGNYTVAEVVPPGFTPTTPNPVNATLGSFDSTVTFGNAPPGMIMGVKFLDSDRDGIRDGNEPGLPGYQIYIDSNGDDQLTPGEISTTSDKDGNWMFNNLPQGLYKIREVQQPGTIQTSQKLDIQLAQGHTWGCAQIGNFPLNDLVIIKFEDTNRNGRRDQDEAFLEGIPFFLDFNQNGRPDSNEPFTTTGTNGTAIFRNLQPGTYPVFEALDQTPAGLQIATGPNPLLVGVPGPITTAAGQIPDPPRTIPEGQVATAPLRSLSALETDALTNPAPGTLIGVTPAQDPSLADIISPPAGSTSDVIPNLFEEDKNFGSTLVAAAVDSFGSTGLL